MQRIYFDKQIFSHLYNGEKIIYQKFLKDLLENRDKFLFCYSQAHLLDLQNDKTEIKYKELDFIEKLVGNNYISYNGIEKTTSCYLETPSQAFESMNKEGDEEEEHFSFSTFFEDIDSEYLTLEQSKQLESVTNVLKNQKFDLSFLQNSETPKEFLELIGKCFPVGDLKPMSIIELLEQFSGILKTLAEDRKAYKGLRNMIYKIINNGKFTIEFNDIDFNDDLKNSVLQKSFVEFVDASINPNGDKGITDYDFYIYAYFSLDLLGISKEKNAIFRNLINDAYHSYYGTFCDYVVSDDQGFLKKTKALYKLLGIESKVYGIDEFINYFTLLKNSLENDRETFF